MMSHQNAQQAGIFPPSESISPRKRITLWKINRRQMIAIFIGMLLYIPLMHTFIYVGNFIYPATFLALLLGLIFGPWVGLVVGGAGTFLEMFVSIQWHLDNWVAWNPWDSIRHTTFNWESIVSFALIGFISGLSALQTQGRFHTVQARSIALLLSAFALLVGFAFFNISTFLFQHLSSSFSFWIGDGVVTAFFDFVILFPTLTFLGNFKKPFRDK